ncbi:unnamed protein product [Hymenolepis diminuta]|uniref:Neuropathy target esterase sws n=1 Tax=Hymenolepis diminuta TaxID=6216 RepID=A0A564YNV5_HYMDI|nr:unnamed protein product [Hymenolepis diminuta]
MDGRLRLCRLILVLSTIFTIIENASNNEKLSENVCQSDSDYFYSFSKDNANEDSTSSDLIYKLILSGTLLFVVSPLIAIVIWMLCQRLRHKVPFRQENKVNRFRFRNRDKIRYYAIRLTRNFNSIASKSRDEQRELIIGYVKRLFSGDSEGRNPLLKRRSLPESFFEPESGDEGSDMPEDLKIMVKHFRLLSYLGRDVVQNLADVISTKELEAGSYLYREGDPEDKIYVVKSGRIDLQVTDKDDYSTVIHKVRSGGNPYSLMAILDVMNNHESTYHRIEAVAKTKSKVICLAISDLIKVCRNHPPTNLRLAQMIVIRLHRVTFSALHNFFGLDKELFSQERQTFVKGSAVQSLLSQLGEETKPFKYKGSHGKSKSVITMPIGTSNTDHLMPPSNHTSTESNKSTGASKLTHSSSGKHLDANANSLEVVGTLVSTNSVSKLLELGEAATANTPSTNRKDSSGLAPSTKIALIRAAQEDLARIFGLPEGTAAFDDGMLTVTRVAEGEFISKEGELQPALYYILSGGFVITQIPSVAGPGSTTPVPVLHTSPGELVGLMGVITGEANNCSAQASVASRVAIIGRDDFFHLVRAHPQVLINAACLVNRKLSRLLRLADFAIEWHGVGAGKALYKQGDSSNYIYVVINGRFREFHTNPDGTRSVIAESGRGAFLGYVEVTSAKPRVNTVLAIRDSEVVKMPSILLNWLKRLTPHPVSRFIQLLSDRLMQPASYGILEAGQNSFVPFTAGPGTDFGVGGVLQHSQLNAAGSGGTMTNLRAIAFLPTSPEINTEAFTLELQHAMSVFGSTVRLTSNIVKKRLGDNAFESPNEYRLCSWLSHQEDLHRMVFYIADSCRTPSTAWTRRCLRQADCVVLLALASASDPTRLSPVEQAMSYLSTKVTKILVLLYPLETEYPPVKRTAAWLNARPWVTQHYHIRCPPRVLNPTVKNLISFYSKVFLVEEPSLHSDMSRLARYLTGQAVGLVLGGGGARGGAHVGVIRVLQEAGIPVDMVGGTSIGALIGAMWAEETRVAQLSQRSRDFAIVFKSIWPKLRDITYPTVSLFSGYEFNTHIEATFKDRQIEDLWLPYFCVTTDISNCKMRVHTSGSLWRYVRSSMSLSGYMPPLCDPVDGSYLLDGGYVNNVPADIMAALGAKTIYAVDVGSVYETNLTNYGDWLSGWWLIYQRFFRCWGPPIKVPNFTEIQSRLAYISCIRQLEEVKASGICHYLRPPIDKFQTLQFAAFEEIVSVGYNYAKEVLASWRETGEFQKMIPAIYKRARSNSVLSTSSGASSFHRKTRSVSYGVAKPKEHESTPVGNKTTEQNPSLTDSGIAEVPMKRRRGSLQNLSPKHSVESSEDHIHSDFDAEWCKTWLRLHPERISHLAMGSTAFDKPEDTNFLSMAEQWLYTSSATIKDKYHQYHRHAHPNFKRLADLTKSNAIVTSDSDIEGPHLNETAGRASDDDFLVTASDPDFSSLRFTEGGRVPSLPGSQRKHRSRHRGVSVSETTLSGIRQGDLKVDAGEVDDIESCLEDDPTAVAVVKPSRHRLHHRGSLNRLSGRPSKSTASRKADSKENRL